VDILKFRCRCGAIVPAMTTLYSRTQIDELCTRMRLIRESRHLTLIQAAKLSNGEVTAITLGSYERGDRSVSARKLIVIAQLYEVPISELFEAPKKYMIEERISIDVRKILTASDPSAVKITSVIRNIARMRGDWNGEVISLRGQDINNFEVFTGLTSEEIAEVLHKYNFLRSK